MRKLQYVLCFAILACGCTYGAERIAAKDAKEPLSNAEIAKLWDRVLDNSDPDAVLNTYNLIGQVKNDQGEFDAAACRAHAKDVDAAVSVNPIGLAVLDMAYRCAQALGDNELANKRLRVLEAALRYAVESLPPDNGATPIRVLREYDVQAFIAASGQELLYSYYDVLIGRAMPLHVALWDAERKRERWLTFDYLDSRARLYHRERNSEFPLFRSSIANEILKALAKAPGSPAEAALALRESFSKLDRNARMKSIETLAKDGNFAAVVGYSTACLAYSQLNCGKSLVDVLLPWAEKRHAIAMVMLAWNYASGNGVERDEKAARKLLDAADARLGDGRGRLALAALQMVSGRLQADAFIVDDVYKLAQSGNAMAQLIHGTLRVLSSKSDTEAHKEILHAAQTGIGPAQGLYGALLVEQRDFAAAAPWLEKGATQGDPHSQRLLATLYENGSGVKQDLDAALHWNKLAGQGRNVEAMMWVAHYYMRSAPPTADTNFRAQGWLLSADAAGDKNAAYELAQMYEQGGEGLDGGPKEAEKLYRAISKLHNSAQARRALASMLVFGRGVDKNPEEARQLLKQDADRGDMRSQVVLGELLWAGDFGKMFDPEGLTWLRKAEGAGDDAATDAIAMLTYYGRGMKADPRVALDRWQKLVAKDYLPAINNSAWALCTAPDEHLRDGARGLEIVKRVENRADISAAVVDTIAACYAASGEFDRAVEVEKSAISKAQALTPVPEKMITNLRARMEGYRRHERYTEQSDKG